MAEAESSHSPRTQRPVGYVHSEAPLRIRKTYGTRLFKTKTVQNMAQ